MRSWLVSILAAPPFVILLYLVHKAIKVVWRKLQLPAPFSLPMREFCDDKTAYCWEDWHRDMRAKHPVRYFCSRTVPKKLRRCGRKVRNAWWWIKYHTTHRYHLLDMRNPMYRHGWVDRSEAVLYASFALLKEYVEKEKPFDIIDWSATENHLHAGNEIRELYAWWTEGRFQDQARLDGMEFSDEWMQLSDDLEKKDDEMLRRLIAIRRFLWT